MSESREAQPMREPTGRPVASGFAPLPEAEQEEHRRRWRKIQADLASEIEEMDRCRSRAAVEARTAWIR